MASEINSLDLAQAIAQVIIDSKAENVCLYDLRDISSLTDFSIVCTGLSIPHLRSILRDVEQKISETLGEEPVNMEKKATSLWIVMDYINVMVHIMGQETREFYAIDKLMSKGKMVPLSPVE